MEFQMKEARELDEMRASHNDLLSVQKSISIKGWPALVDVQDNGRKVERSLTLRLKM